MTRDERIRQSLDALKAPQPTTLNASEWAEILAENEDEDETKEQS